MMTSELTFDPGPHEYRRGKVRLPSVTQIVRAMGLGGDFSGMPPEQLAWYGDRGTQAHRAATLSALGNLDRRELDPRLEPYVTAADRFVRDYRFGLLAYETPIAWASGDPEGVGDYAGTLDWYGRVEPRQRWIVELKTGAPQPGDIYQAVAYRYAWVQTYSEQPVTHVAVVYLGKDGRYRIEYVPAADWPRLFAKFLRGATQVWQDQMKGERDGERTGS